MRIHAIYNRSVKGNPNPVPVARVTLTLTLVLGVLIALLVGMWSEVLFLSFSHLSNLSIYCAFISRILRKILEHVVESLMLTFDVTGRASGYRYSTQGNDTNNFCLAAYDQIPGLSWNPIKDDDSFRLVRSLHLTIRARYLSLDVRIPTIIVACKNLLWAFLCVMTYRPDISNFLRNDARKTRRHYSHRSSWRSDCIRDERPRLTSTSFDRFLP